MAVESVNELFAADEGCYSNMSIYPEKYIEGQDCVGWQDGQSSLDHMIDDVDRQSFLHYYRRELWMLSALIHSVCLVQTMPSLLRIRRFSHYWCWGLVVGMTMGDVDILDGLQHQLLVGKSLRCRRNLQPADEYAAFCQFLCICHDLRQEYYTISPN